MSKSSIIRHVEAITRGCIDALNNRDLDISSPAWRYVADDVTIRSTNLVAQTPDGDIGLQRHLDSIANTVAIRPDYRMYISELHTDVSTREKHATVFASLETHGNPPGVILQGVVIFRFSETGGKWICARIESARGISSLAPVEYQAQAKSTAQPNPWHVWPHFHQHYRHTI